MNLLNNDNFVTDKVKSIMNMKEEMIILENDVNMVKKLLMEQIAWDLYWYLSGWY